jgi:hypothetical protein
MQPSTLTFLDSYCERAGQAGLLAEPLNAISNLAFMLAAVFAYRALRRSGTIKFSHVGDLWLLILALFSIGIGSGLWHLEPNGATLLADVLPITFFINLFLISALRRLLRCSWLVTICCWGMYAAATVAAQQTLPPDLLNGTIMYIPSYAALFTMVMALIWKKSPACRVVAGVLLVWTISLILRTVDTKWCAVVPIGTHFLWHILNAYVTYTLLRTLIAYSATARE